jgi:hypothetical protein
MRRFADQHLHVTQRHPGSEVDLGPFLNVVTWILLITSTLAVLTRLITKRALRRRVDVDDAFVIAALVSGLSWIILVLRYNGTLNGFLTAIS